MGKTIRLIAAGLGVALAVALFWATRPVEVAPKAPPPPDQERVETAVFAGGCFWCMEPPFEKIEGVFDAESGYTGGHVEFPSYEEVCRGDTGHVEAVRITFDPDRVRYEDLLEVFWRQIDPTDDEGQFVDRGSSYVSAIFAQSEQQRSLAESSKSRLSESQRFDTPIVTPVLEAAEFYPAEEYHQDYYLKNALKYKYYRYRSGRDAFLDEAWADEREYAVPTRTADPIPLDEAADPPGTNAETGPIDRDLNDVPVENATNE